MTETWTTPKTDWKPTNFFNQSDYERITGNIRYLHEMADTLYAAPFFELDPMSSAGIGIIVTAALLNSVEDNVQALGENTFLMPDWQEGKNFKPGDTAWNYEDLNRIEQDIVILKIMLERQKAGLKTLAFELGGGEFG